MQLSREYFENVNRDKTMDEVFNEIGVEDGTGGSGVIYYYWNIEDGGKASVIFSSPDLLIERITISYSDQQYEVIYQREY